MDASTLVSAGDTTFDVRDRLAIINVLSSYGFFIDHSRFEEFCGLFSSRPTVEMWCGKDLLVEGWEQFRDLVIARQQAFERDNVERRHVLTAVRFDAQGAQAASGQAYVLLYSTEHDASSLVTTGCYEFTTVNERGQWKIDRLIGHVDSRNYGKGVGR
ncbi:hypothetical protein D0Z08_05115 [Nocardioides immobilis]|uniref:SnoaL-like domain-containing protein n=1 Tax=Nocardioides immobilis TaxID=2049295 RepID=A0A417Y774_9ACTN|nr:nuclear transport factor 2 family protein [Nocardioides immobilis]RHW28351.1 hypothetical protein D0Z08_05115 [Nocardioides immobilis]